MPTPKEVFDNPADHWGFITSASDDEFEGQYFDRKEAGRQEGRAQLSKSQIDAISDQIRECISAFANANHAGGLLALGISNHGELKGIGHLTEKQINRLTDLDSHLKCNCARSKLVDCTNTSGDSDKILLIYTACAERSICETRDRSPTAWIRQGKQNVILSEQLRDQLRRDKSIIDFELSPCCLFLIDDVDKDVLNQFRKGYLRDAMFQWDDTQLLYHVGAILPDDNRTQYRFTNAGLLFFGINPQRILSRAYVRLMQFEVNSTEYNERGLPTKDKEFKGAIPQQIRQIRTFFRESSFFKTYQVRKPDGGFKEDPELPYIAVDEAVVNSLAHRDYGVALPIECSHYKDAFTVANPGRILQRGRDLPLEFSLDEEVLDSMPRNSKIIEWLRVMRDEDGAAFVRALSEGTKAMRREMQAASLPAPKYKITDGGNTVVTLLSDAVEREARQRATSVAEAASEFSNLFPLTLISDKGGALPIALSHDYRRTLLTLIRDALQSKGWYADRFGFGVLVAHRQGTQLRIPNEIQKILRFYPAYSFQMREYWAKHYLCVDYTLEIKNILNVQQLNSMLEPSALVDRIAVARINAWHRGKILKVDSEFTSIHIFELGIDHDIRNDSVIPDLSIAVLKSLINKSGAAFDFDKEIKVHSLSMEPGSSRIRSEKTIKIVHEIATSIFPLRMGNAQLCLHTTPESLHSLGKEDSLQVGEIQEPTVRFGNSVESDNIRNGITNFGVYDSRPKSISLVPICTISMREDMGNLIQRLKVGKYRYKGAERTFKTRFDYTGIVTVSSPDDIIEECQRLLAEHPEWAGDKSLSRLFLIHTPEQGHAADDENAPYYRVKRLLMEQGVPNQMVDTPTLVNPEWKDLNLALNIAAKCGVTPWVLTDRIPEADFFIGLSYTQSHKRGRGRLVGYAMVFNRFGCWEFYSGNTESFTYEERAKYFASITQRTLAKLSLSDTPNIYFHYSAKFSRDDRQTILDAARNVKPGGTYSFVSINTHHNIRLYDHGAETDGSLRRGHYVMTTPKQILISTTGYNPFRKSLGTPKPLEVTIWTESPRGAADAPPDLKSLANQILCLTKLNWASTDSICGEPITTKYAGDIAYLTDSFLRQSGKFCLHPVLEATPWFI